MATYTDHQEPTCDPIYTHAPADWSENGLPYGARCLCFECGCEGRSTITFDFYADGPGAPLICEGCKVHTGNEQKARAEPAPDLIVGDGDTAVLAQGRSGEKIQFYNTYTEGQQPIPGPIRVYLMYLDASNGEWLEYTYEWGRWIVEAKWNGCGTSRTVPEMLELLDKQRRE